MLFALIAGGVLAMLVSLFLRARPGLRTLVGGAALVLVAAYVFFAHGGLTPDAIFGIAANAAEAAACAGLAAFGVVLLASGALFAVFERVAPD